jgi:hypothetical protein
MMTRSEQVDTVWAVAAPNVLDQMKARLLEGARYDQLVCMIAAGPERLPLVALAIRGDALARLSSGGMKLGRMEILGALTTLRRTPRRRGLMIRLVYLLDPGPPLPDVPPGKWWGDHVPPPPAIALLMLKSEASADARKREPRPRPNAGRNISKSHGNQVTKVDVPGSNPFSRSISAQSR